jgi:hypothetical protein
LLQVGTDSKAVSDAWSLVEKKHGDKVAGLFVSVDADKGRALAYAGGAWLNRLMRVCAFVVRVLVHALIVLVLALVHAH